MDSSNSQYGILVARQTVQMLATVTLAMLMPTMATPTVLAGVLLADEPVAETPAAETAAKTPPDASSLKLSPTAPLPWDRKKGNPDDASSRDVIGVKQLLAMLGVSDERLAAFAGDGPLSDAERAAVADLLFRLHRIDAVQWADLLDENIGSAALSAAPAEHLAQVTHLEGRVVRVDRRSPPSELAERFLQEDRLSTAQRKRLPSDIVKAWIFEQYYEIEVEIEGFAKPATVFARQVPLAWLTVSAGQRAVCDALFLRFSEGSPVFVVDRVAWRPQKAEPALGVTYDLAWLSRGGVDLGEFDLILDKQPLSALESEGFYQLLGAVASGRDPPKPATARQDSLLFDLLSDSHRQRGRLTSFTGDIRRITKIVLGERDRAVREKFGFDHYYEVGMFVPLENVAIKIGKGEEASDFTNNFPIIFCTPSLPDALEVGDDLNVRARVSGFFLKVYSYRSEYISGNDPRGRQLSPMLIGFPPQVLDERGARHTYAGAIVGVGFVVILGGIWLSLWRLSRRDAQVSKSTQSRRFEQTGEGSLDDAGLKQKSGPDFSGLK